MPSSGCASGSRTSIPTRAGSSRRSPSKSRTQRKARDLSQAELAELTGTTQSAIARLEAGGRPPRIDTLLRIAEALDCELVVDLQPRKAS